MEQLWSPWRMEYIQANKDVVEDRCVFCALLDEGDPDGERILRQDPLAFAVLAKYPYAPGHVLPRWSGDTNFMPVIGETRVLPELLDETYRKLRPGFEGV